MSRPFRFGMSAAVHRHPRELAEFAVKAEDLGYSAVSIPDHLDEQCGPLVGLTAAAAATSSIALTTLVLANDYRHPVVLAKELTSLDQYSDGRLEWGIGAGWMISDYEEAGISLDRAGVRIARLAEAIAVMKGCFGDGAFSFDGEHYTVSELDALPKPTQRPHPRLIVAGGGPKVLGLAGREADIVGINFNLSVGKFDPAVGPSGLADATDAKIDAIKAGAGDRFDELELQTRVHLALVTDDRDATIEAMAPGFGLTPAQVREMPHVLCGSAEQIIEDLHMWRERWGITYVTWGAEFADAMAPVVAALG